MSREIKRVALDFDYPYGRMIWKGYHNPYKGLKCQLCDGSGYSHEYKKLEDEWYSIGWDSNLTQEDVQALIDANRLWEFTRVPLTEEHHRLLKETKKHWLPFNNGYIPTAKEVNEWSNNGIELDSCDRYVCCKAKLIRLGLPLYCPDCDGKGEFFPTDEYEKLHDNFVRIEPPVGEGYQLWSTTTEGTPLSPVFDTPEKLTQWLVDNNISTFAYNTATYEEWLEFITNHQWCMDLVMTKDGIKTGIHTVL